MCIINFISKGKFTSYDVLHLLEGYHFGFKRRSMEGSWGEKVRGAAKEMGRDWEGDRWGEEEREGRGEGKKR